jgi:hypothetical protein
MKNHKPWFDEGCTKLLDQKKESNLQWLQDPRKRNGDNLNNVKHKASSHLKNKRREYLKEKINEFAMYSKNRNVKDLYRGINEFKKGYQPRSDLVKDENDDLADSHNIFCWCKNYFFQLLFSSVIIQLLKLFSYSFSYYYYSVIVHSVSDVRQIEIHTAEPSVPDPSPFEGEIAITELKKYKLPGSDEILSELMQGGSETLCSVIHKFINSV